MADIVTLRQRLAEAEAAMHDAATGKSVLEVMRDGKRMRFADMSLAQRQGYIDGLAADIADAETAAGSARPRRRFIAVGF